MIKIYVSIILGLLIATLFGYVCNLKKVIIIKGFSKKDIGTKTFSFKDKCYKFKPVKCKHNL